MLGVTDYGSFVVAIIVFLLIPGPGNLAWRETGLHGRWSDHGES
jgi:leucine efflux protein